MKINVGFDSWLNKIECVCHSLMKPLIKSTCFRFSPVSSKSVRLKLGLTSKWSCLDESHSCQTITNVIAKVVCDINFSTTWLKPSADKLFVCGNLKDLFDTGSSAVLANLDQNSILPVEDDLANTFGSLVLNYVDLDDLVLWLEKVALHLVVITTSFHHLAIAHLEL